MVNHCTLCSHPLTRDEGGAARHELRGLLCSLQHTHSWMCTRRSPHPGRRWSSAPRACSPTATRSRCSCWAAPPSQWACRPSRPPRRSRQAGRPHAPPQTGLRPHACMHARTRGGAAHAVQVGARTLVGLHPHPLQLGEPGATLCGMHGALPSHIHGGCARPLPAGCHAWCAAGLTLSAAPAAPRPTRPTAPAGAALLGLWLCAVQGAAAQAAVRAQQRGRGGGAGRWWWWGLLLEAQNSVACAAAGVQAAMCLAAGHHPRPPLCS